MDRSKSITPGRASWGLLWRYLFIWGYRIVVVAWMLFMIGMMFNGGSLFFIGLVVVGVMCLWWTRKWGRDTRLWYAAQVETLYGENLDRGPLRGDVNSGDMRYNPVDNPFDVREDGSIRPGDPAWDALMESMNSGGVIMGNQREDGTWDVQKWDEDDEGSK